jgi:hypothetical protein
METLTNAMKINLPVNVLLAILILTSSLRGGELVPIKTTNTRGETETMWVFQDDRGWKSYRTQAKRTALTGSTTPTRHFTGPAMSTAPSFGRSFPIAPLRPITTTNRAITPATSRHQFLIPF